MNTEHQDEMALLLQQSGFVEATCKASGQNREFVSARYARVAAVDLSSEGIAFFLPLGSFDREKATYVVNYPEGLIKALKECA